MDLNRDRLKRRLPNGTFTVESPKGGHRTFRVATIKRGKLKGERVLSILVGPNNEGDFEGFGSVKANGILIWRNFRRVVGAPANAGPAFVTGTDPLGDGWSFHQKSAVMLWSLVDEDEDSRFRRRGYRLHWEGRCISCNRKLTTPESIARGQGPVCARRSI